MDDLAHVLRPRAVGGVLDHDGVVEVVSSLERDGRPVFRDLRWGVYVVLKAPNDYAAACFKQYGLPTDASGRYAGMYKPFHLIGLELSISVLERRPTQGADRLHARVARRCRRRREARPAGRRNPRRRGRIHGLRKARPSPRSLALKALPIGLAHGIPLTRDVAAGAIVTEADVALDQSRLAARVRGEMVESVAATSLAAPRPSG